MKTSHIMLIVSAKEESGLFAVGYLIDNVLLFKTGKSIY